MRKKPIILPLVENYAKKQCEASELHMANGKREKKKEDLET